MVSKHIVKQAMKPDGETVNKINEELTRTECFAHYLSSKGLDSISEAGLQGLSLGWSDEMHGAMGGLGYGIQKLFEIGSKYDSFVKQEKVFFI